MEILTYQECNQTVKEKVKLWTMRTYIQSWPYLSFKNRQKLPVFYLYVFLLALNIYFVVELNMLSSIISAYLGLQAYTYVSTIIYAYLQFLGGHPENYVEDFDEYFARDYNELFICADDNNNLLGCVAMTKQTSEYSSMELRRMRVDRKSRGTGLATRLVEKAEEFARSRGESRIELATTCDQVAALNVYKRHGFKVTKVEPGGRIGFLPGIGFDMAYLAKDLN